MTEEEATNQHANKMSETENCETQTRKEGNKRQFTSHEVICPGR